MFRGGGLEGSSGDQMPVEFLFPEIVSWPLGSERKESPATTSLLQCSLPFVVAGSVDGGFEGGQEGSDLLPREQVCNAQLKEIVGCAVRDQGLETSTRRRRGRPRKGENRDKQLSHSISSSSQAEVSSIGRELMLLPVEFSEPRGVLTRAMSALFMGKRLGLEYSCSDVVALNQLAAQISARIAS